STGTPGPHDFAVRVVLFVRAKITLQHRHVHRIPHPTFVTIAKRPSDRGGTTVDDINFGKRKGKYFCMGTSAGGWA
ncbi:MAG: hypothetical protein ABW213_08240, partial [Tardiphaga sp.]